MRRDRIRFPDASGKSRPWVAVAQGQAEELARMDLHGRPLRAFIAALSRMERNGHAHFKRGELRHILADVNTSTGEIKRVSADTVRRAIGDLVSRGLLVHGSWALDLRVSSLFAQRAEGERTDCPRKPTLTEEHHKRAGHAPSLAPAA